MTSFCDKHFMCRLVRGLLSYLLHLQCTRKKFATGSSLGGAVVSKLGTTMCFVLDSCTYIIATACVILLQVCYSTALLPAAYVPVHLGVSNSLIPAPTVCAPSLCVGLLRACFPDTCRADAISMRTHDHHCSDLIGELAHQGLSLSCASRPC